MKKIKTFVFLLVTLHLLAIAKIWAHDSFEITANEIPHIKPQVSSIFDSIFSINSSRVVFSLDDGINSRITYFYDIENNRILNPDGYRLFEAFHHIDSHQVVGNTLAITSNNIYQSSLFLFNIEDGQLVNEPIVLGDGAARPSLINIDNHLLAYQEKSDSWLNKRLQIINTLTGQKFIPETDDDFYAVIEPDWRKGPGIYYLGENRILHVSKGSPFSLHFSQIDEDAKVTKKATTHDIDDGRVVLLPDNRVVVVKKEKKKYFLSCFNREGEELWKTDTLAAGKEGLLRVPIVDKSGNLLVPGRYGSVGNFVSKLYYISHENGQVLWQSENIQKSNLAAPFVLANGEFGAVSNQWGQGAEVLFFSMNSNDPIFRKQVYLPRGDFFYENAIPLAPNSVLVRNYFSPYSGRSLLISADISERVRFVHGRPVLKDEREALALETTGRDSYTLSLLSSITGELLNQSVTVENDSALAVGTTLVISSGEIGEFGLFTKGHLSLVNIKDGKIIDKIYEKGQSSPIRLDAHSFGFLRSGSDERRKFVKVRLFEKEEAQK